MTRHARNTTTSLTGEEARAWLIASLPVTERRLNLSGIPTAVLEGGEGAPVVLLHGQGEFAATWAAVLPTLVGSHRVVAPDLPGHGDTGLGEGKLDVQRSVAWLRELLDCTCSTPPVLVGHLLGGALALRYAIAQGERIAGLVLVDTLGLARYRPSPGFALAMVGFVARPTERSRDRLFQRCFLDYDAARAQAGESWEPLAAYALDRARSRELKRAMRRLMPHVGVPAIPPDDLARITVPTTLIHGRHDLQVRLPIAEEASARYGWPLHPIEDAGDDPAVEQPAAFLDALQTALTAAQEGPRP
jgi:pimeloyl-ACP methyl ester carboxylesterase